MCVKCETITYARCQSTVSTHHDINSPIVSSTLVGWQQMTTFDFTGSNREEIYWEPTRRKSSIVTFGIFCSKRLQHMCRVY